MAISVFVVEDSNFLRSLLLEIIASWPGFEVCGEAATAEEAYECVPACQPDVVTVDIELPGMWGIELVRRLVARDPGLQCIMLTAYENPRLRGLALEAGAVAYVDKGKIEKLHAALLHVADAAEAGPPAAHHVSSTAKVATETAAPMSMIGTRARLSQASSRP